MVGLIVQQMRDKLKVTIKYAATNQIDLVRTSNTINNCIPTSIFPNFVENGIFINKQIYSDEMDIKNSDLSKKTQLSDSSLVEDKGNRGKYMKLPQCIDS